MNSKHKTLAVKGESRTTPEDQDQNSETSNTPEIQKPRTSPSETATSEDQSKPKRVVMMRDMGAQDKDFFHGYMRHVWEAHSRAGEVDEMDFLFVIAFVQDLRPKNQAAAALALQAAMTHLYAMRFAQRLSSATNVAEMELYERLYTKMIRSYVTQLETFKAYNSNDVGITVQNFSVKDVGQAIVGNITHNALGVVPEVTAASPPAIIDANVAPMPRVNKRRPERVPRVQLKKHGQ